MSISNVNGLFAAYQYANRAQKTAPGQTSFTQQLRNTAESNGATRVDEYTEYLKSRYGANVMVKNVGKDQRSIDNFGASIAGYNNVVIAPNILEKMANDPEKAAYYEKKIQAALDRFPSLQAELSAAGHEIHSYAVGIDSDGIVHTYVTGDLKPEVRAKIEAKMKAEDEAKRARREKYKELSQEAAEKRRELAAIQNQKQAMAEALRNSMLSAETNFYITNPSQAVAAAVTAYESTASTFSNSVMENL